jgi:3-methyl-2-oxobutanoate hydroxymethyltransferase
MSTTYTLDTSTSRANPTPAPLRRLTIPALRGRKVDGLTETPIVVLTAYTARQAQLLDPHCDLLLVGDSLGQVIYGLPSSVPVTLEMMIAHGAAVVRGSYHSAVIVDMPFGSYEASPQQAFESAARILKETGAAGVKLEGGQAMAPTIAFLSERGIPVCAHIGLTPQAVNALGGYGPRGRSAAEAAKIRNDARAVASAGCFAMVIEGVIESLAVEITADVPCPTIGIGASAACDGQVLVTEDLLGMFERTPRFVKRYADLATTISDAVTQYAAEVQARTFPGEAQLYGAKK